MHENHGGCLRKMRGPGFQVLISFVWRWDSGEKPGRLFLTCISDVCEAGL